MAVRSEESRQNSQIKIIPKQQHPADGDDVRDQSSYRVRRPSATVTTRPHPRKHAKWFETPAGRRPACRQGPAPAESRLPCSAIGGREANATHANRASPKGQFSRYHAPAPKPDALARYTGAGTASGSDELADVNLRATVIVGFCQAQDFVGEWRDVALAGDQEA